MIITPSGNTRTYQDFKRHIPDRVRPLFEQIRDYCLALDDRVVEDVRMHRIVFCKSITFRWFVDAEPQEDCVILKIQRDRKTQAETVSISEITQDVLRQIRQAFDSIH